LRGFAWIFGTFFLLYFFPEFRYFPLRLNGNQNIYESNFK